ncbi:hypothetical protein [Maribacter sp. 2307ULW6-5]|uniref:hypothetical protein n=1 Tax=Maribacter sp. 2307ULW6-5 TaxID=3386275 RepID=UPI0039BD29B3
MQINTYDAFSRLTPLQIDGLTKFIHKHQIEDNARETDIRRAIRYASKEVPGFGGIVYTAEEDGMLIGAIVMNRTGLEGSLPEQLVVSIAVHREHRDSTVYRKMLNYVVDYSCGDIGVQVKKDNPLVPVLEDHGFKNDYIQMNLKQ